MIIKIKQYKHQKVEVDSRDFELPEETKYYFETGIRRSIRIVPKFATWTASHGLKKGDIYQYEVTCVYLSFTCKIEKFTINVSDFEDASRIEKNPFLNAWTNHWFDARSIENFEADLNEAINTIIEK